MAGIKNSGSMFVVDDVTGDVLGVQQPDGFVSPFPSRSQAAAAQEVAYPGALVTDWGAAGALSTTGSTGTGFAFALDSTVLCNGKPAVKCTLQSDAGAQTFIGIWTPTNPIRLRDVESVQVPILFTSTNGSAIDYTSLKVWLMLSDGKSIRLSFSALTAAHQAGVFQTVSFSRGAAAVTQDPMSSLDAASVTVTSVRVVVMTTGNASAFPIWFGEVRADVARKPGRVVLCMDGEYTSQYSMIFPVMRALGLTGSLAVTNADIGLAGRMSATQIDEMYANGWECIHHTYGSTKANGYVNAADWPTSLVIAEDIRAQWAYFRTRGWTRGIGYGVWGYAYAFTSAYTQARQNLVRDGLKAGGILAMRKSVPYNNENATSLVPMTRMPIDPLVITGGIQVTSTDTYSNLIAVIDAAESRGELAIITIHRAVADTATPGSLEIRIGDLSKALRHLANRVSAGGIVCEPFGATYSKLFADRPAA